MHWSLSTDSYSMDGVKPAILTSYHYSKTLPLIAVNSKLLLFLYLPAAFDTVDLIIKIKNDTVGHDNKLLSIRLYFKGLILPSF